MEISGKTKLVGIFGDPVDHTISPAMQNAAFEALGLDMAYIPFHVRKSPAHDLKAAIASIRALNLRGVNVTIPHKEKVLKYLDEVDPDAKAIGAVNTIVNRNGKLVGYNTDGPGYLLSLKEDTGFTVRGKRIIILGAGGAARAILKSALDKRPASVVVANRTLKRAEDLVREFESTFTVEMQALKLDESIAPFAKKASLVVNTTSIGMKGSGTLDVPLNLLPKGAIVSDIVYVPLETAFLSAARARGLRVHYGLSMLVRQGALTFELWTGKKAPVEVMQRAALAALSLK